MEKRQKDIKEKEKNDDLVKLLTGEKKLYIERTSALFSCIEETPKIDFTKLIEKEVEELEKKREATSSPKRTKFIKPSEKGINKIDKKKSTLLSDLKSEEEILVSGTTSEIQLWEKKSNSENKNLEKKRKQVFDKASEWEESKKQWRTKIEQSKSEFDSTFGQWYSLSSNPSVFNSNGIFITPKTETMTETKVDEIKTGYEQEMEKELMRIKSESNTTSTELDELYKNFSDKQDSDFLLELQNSKLIKISSMIHNYQVQREKQEKQESSEDEEYFSADEN